MKKTNFVLVFLCVFAISSLVLGQELKPGQIEFLTREHKVGILFKYVADDYTQNESFESEELLTLHVPPSPKSPAIFLYMRAQGWCEWTTFYQRMNHSIVRCELSSDIIPEGIVIYQGMIVSDVNETNLAGDYSLGPEKSWQSVKLLISRDSTLVNTPGEILVYYRGGGKVPNDIAVPLLNRLIDKGFDVKLSTNGDIQGSRYVQIVALLMEATRLSKDKE